MMSLVLDFLTFSAMLISMANAEWPLVVIALLTLFAVTYQSYATMRSAKAAEKAADAALMNAKAMIDAERAWVFVHWRKLGTRSFQLYMRNEGRIPAQIVHIVGRDAFTNLLDLEKRELSPIPNYGPDSELMQTRALAPKEEWHVPDWSTHIDSVVTADHLEEIIGSRQRFHIFGRIKYGDALHDSLHETRFCFFWSPVLDAFIPGGPPEYTRYT